MEIKKKIGTPPSKIHRSEDALFEVRFLQIQTERFSNNEKLLQIHVGLNVKSVIFKSLQLEKTKCLQLLNKFVSKTLSKVTKLKFETVNVKLSSRRPSNFESQSY
jgi:hypothetical protein